MSKTEKWIGLAGWVALCWAVSFLASQFVPGVWFDLLKKPSWNPPDAVFGPVWGVLYTLMGVAAWLVWKKAGGIREAAWPLTLFIIQLVLNGMWSWFFFGRHQLGLALADIVLLDLTIIVTMVRFGRIDKWAGILFIPYVAWVTFAMLLNLAIWQMNP